ncbi:hypothetical protein OG302_01305 [Streptomyces sp. NBC_01283]|uniref:hypothetical protein n=1 Tax=Streptomyces sp. NBC_01283 TaxID=2903812 RepID=UPI00352CF4F3|nr:hypothetical protein OG302_01305 [Streptomyces sp. NBC_01283]
MSGFFSRSQTALQLAAQQQQAERQIRADLATQMREPRRQAYASYAAEASQQADALLWTCHALSHEPPRREAAVEHLDAFMQRGSTAYEGVLLEGPEEVALAASELSGAIAQGTVIAATWLEQGDESAARTGPRDFATELREAHEVAQKALRDFRFLAMDAIRADGGHPEAEQARARTAALREALGRPTWG